MYIYLLYKLIRIASTAIVHYLRNTRTNTQYKYYNFTVGLFDKKNKNEESIMSQLHFLFVSNYSKHATFCILHHRSRAILFFSICRPCIANTIAYCEEAEVKCPYRDSEYTCESTLQEREIKAVRDLLTHLPSRRSSLIDMR